MREPTERAKKMATAAKERKRVDDAEKVEKVGYFKTPLPHGGWNVMKVEIDPDGHHSVVATYVVDSGTCTCAGFEHRKSCRHLDMVYHKPKAAGRKKARDVSRKVIEAFAQHFEKIEWDSYEFADADEEEVSTVKLKAIGSPFQIGSDKFYEITGIHDGVRVHISIREWE